MRIEIICIIHAVPVQDTLLVSCIWHQSLFLQSSDGLPQMLGLDWSFVIPLFHCVASYNVHGSPQNKWHLNH